jgi:hypothetical protein
MDPYKTQRLKYLAKGLKYLARGLKYLASGWAQMLAIYKKKKKLPWMIPRLYRQIKLLHLSTPVYLTT